MSDSRQSEVIQSPHEIPLENGHNKAQKKRRHSMSQAGARKIQVGASSALQIYLFRQTTLGDGDSVFKCLAGVFESTCEAKSKINDKVTKEQVEARHYLESRQRTSLALDVAQSV